MNTEKLNNKPLETMKHTVRIAYSLPQGFRSKLEKVLRDYQVCFEELVLCSIVNQTYKTESKLYTEMRDRRIELKQMMEYSKLWDEGA